MPSLAFADLGFHILELVLRRLDAPLQDLHLRSVLAQPAAHLGLEIRLILRDRLAQRRGYRCIAQHDTAVGIDDRRLVAVLSQVGADLPETVLGTLDLELCVAHGLLQGPSARSR